MNQNGHKLQNNVEFNLHHESQFLIKLCHIVCNFLFALIESFLFAIDKGGHSNGSTIGSVMILLIQALGEAQLYCLYTY